MILHEAHHPWEWAPFNRPIKSYAWQCISTEPNPLSVPQRHFATIAKWNGTMAHWRDSVLFFLSQLCSLSNVTVHCHSRVHSNELHRNTHWFIFHTIALNDKHIASEYSMNACLFASRVVWSSNSSWLNNSIVLLGSMEISKKQQKCVLKIDNSMQTHFRRIIDTLSVCLSDGFSCGSRQL